MDLSAQPEKYTALTVHYALAAIRARVFDVNTTPCYCRTDVQFMAGNIYRRSPSHYHRSRVLPECEYLPLHCVLHQVMLPTLLESSRHTARLHYGLDPSSCTYDHVQPQPVCRMIAVADSYHYHIMCERANAGSPLAIYQAQQTDLDSPVARTAAYTSTTVPAQCPPKEGRTTRRPRHRSEGSHDSVKTTSQMTPTQGWKEKSSTALRRHQRKMATPPPDTTLQDEGPAPPRGVEPQPIFPNLPCRLPGPRQPAWTPASARDGEPQPIYHKPRLPLHRPKRNPRPVTSTTTPRPFLSRGGPAPPLSIPGTVGFGVGHPPIADVGQRLQTWHLEFNEGPTISVAGQPTRSWFFHLRQGFVHNVDGALTAHHDVVLEPVRVVRGTSLPMSTTSMPSQITSERTPPRAED